MALFKICRGSEENLPTKVTDGYAYFCTDSKNFFIDYTDSTGAVLRAQINAEKAAMLRYIDGETEIEIDPSTIALKDDCASKVSIDQGSANSGMVMSVGDDGRVTHTALSDIIGTLTWGALSVLSGNS